MVEAPRNMHRTTAIKPFTRFIVFPPSELFFFTVGAFLSRKRTKLGLIHKRRPKQGFPLLGKVECARISAAGFFLSVQSAVEDSWTQHCQFYSTQICHAWYFSKPTSIKGAFPKRGSVLNVALKTGDRKMLQNALISTVREKSRGQRASLLHLPIDEQIL